jgi:hypothetical protein
MRSHVFKSFLSSVPGPEVGSFAKEPPLELGGKTTSPEAVIEGCGNDAASCMADSPLPSLGTLHIR